MSRRYDALIFHDRGVEGGVETLAVDFEEVAELVRTRNPHNIGVSGDSRQRFTQLLGGELSSRLLVTGDLRTGFLEKRSPAEISVFNHVARVAYDIIGEAFSNKIIVPDVTTTDDLNW